MPKTSNKKKSKTKSAGAKKAKPTAAAAPNLLLVNMIPRSLSHESNQDSEPTLAVNPRNPQQIVGTAFTPDPMGSTTVAPIFLSIDGGRSWTLNSIVPSETQTGDICVGFSPTNGKLYAGILRIPATDPPSEETRLNILRSNDFQSPNPMTVLVDRLGVDQPFLQLSPSKSTSGPDRLYVGDNDLAVADGKTSTIDFSLNGGVAKAKFKKARIEARATDQQNGPQVRPACHADGTVYLAYMGWRSSTGDWKANTLIVTADLVVVRDDKGGNSAKAFQDLLDPGDSLPGRRIVQGIKFPFHSSEKGVPGQQRLGGDVAIAVDPTNSSVVYVAWSDLRAGVYTMHVRRSSDRGMTWSSTDLLTAARGVNPALAINNAGKVGLLYQQLTGTGSMLEWVTHFQRSSGGTNWNDLTLSKAPADRPIADFSPYLGDYDFLLSVGKDFYGIFSANNAPDMSHFPNGVIYQRNANFTTRTLLDVDNTTPVRVSIDPFFFKLTE